MGTSSSHKQEDLDEPLTNDEIAFIQTSWDAIKDKEYFGVRLMIK